MLFDTRLVETGRLEGRLLFNSNQSDSCFKSSINVFDRSIFH